MSAAVVADITAQHTQPDWPARSTQDPTVRFAEAALGRHVQIRDRSCVYLGCRSSARSADLDHTVDHARGGITTEENSGSLCRRDHRLKHIGRWRLHQPAPGHSTWLSPLGRTYRTQPRPSSTISPNPGPGPTTPTTRHATTQTMTAPSCTGVPPWRVGRDSETYARAAAADIAGWLM